MDDSSDTDVKVEAMYEVKGTFTVKSDDGDKDMKFHGYVFKIKGKYYLSNVGISEN